MDERKRINLLVTLDANYILPLRVLLHSLFLADADALYTVYVAHASLTAEDFAQIWRGIPKNRCEICPITVPEELLNDAPILKRLSKATYYRLIAPSYLPQSVNRILYLDPDIIVLRSLEPFYSMDLRGKLFAAAGHLEGFMNWMNLRRLRIRQSAVYVNAGVLLMDVEKLRAQGNTERIFDYVRQNGRRLLLGDQDVVNAFYDGQILPVDTRKYNLDEKIFEKYQRRGKIDAQWVRVNTAIIHYDGSKKPWNQPYSGALGAHFSNCRKDLEETIGAGL